MATGLDIPFQAPPLAPPAGAPGAPDSSGLAGLTGASPYAAAGQAAAALLGGNATSGSDQGNYASDGMQLTTDLSNFFKGASFGGTAQQTADGSINFGNRTGGQSAAQSAGSGGGGGGLLMWLAVGVATIALIVASIGKRG